MPEGIKFDLFGTNVMTIAHGSALVATNARIKLKLGKLS
jgi:hypothetical protein